ncbi:MAG: methylmalonyl-CoA epimerase [Candidatus Cloacimonadota bacterium]|nr:MAG: methylmalonyl-CoA epimerase [Candidatus Cloacimonadota bacterium]
MLTKIDHIGIAVNDLESAMKVYGDFTLKDADHVEELDSEGVKIAFFNVGESAIELLQPTREDSPIAKFINKRGEGIHHICYGVKDLEKSMENLVKLGYKCLDEKPRNGAHNTRVAFFHPKQTLGTLIELSEKK